MRWAHGLDEHGQPSAGPDYCRTVCGASTCSECPRPVVLPENDAAIDVFEACAGRWVRSASGRELGLDWAQVQAAAHLLRVKHTRRALRGLQTIQRELLRLMELQRGHANRKSAR